MTGLKTNPDYTPVAQHSVTSMATEKPTGGGELNSDTLGRSDDVAARVDHGRCRWVSCSPESFQKFRRPACFLVWLCWAAFVQGLVVNGFVNVVISTVERRFEISSTESGLIASCYDIASVLCLIPISYFGGRGRKPVYLSVGMLVLALGSFVFSLPHFTTGLYYASSTQQPLCAAGANGTACDGSSSRLGLSDYRLVFYLAQLLHGAGAAPLYTLGTTYLDENLPLRSTAMYHGIFYACSICGPAVGYLLGGTFLNLYTDIDQVDEPLQGLTKDNPRWVGAWWFGFLFGGVLAFISAVLLFGFPKSLPGSEVYAAEKGKEVYRSKKPTEETSEQKLGFRHIWTSLKVLLTNPTFMFLSLAAGCEGLLVSGFSTFAAKFVEFQFSLTSSAAAQYVGLVAVPAAGGGTLLGGWLVKRFDLDVRRILIFCLVTTLLAVVMGLVFLVHCPDVPFAGISLDYMEPSGQGQYLGSVQLQAQCNSGCACAREDYNPVCGRDGVMYYSPCHAGCNDSFSDQGTQFSNCSCVVYNYTASDVANANYWQVEKGKCESSCEYLPLFLPMLGLLMLTIFVTTMPALTASLRCVSQDQRSFALGIQWILTRCLGSMPGPIMFGKVIDVTCLVWQQNCDGEGACFFYDNRQMGYNIMTLSLVFNSLSCVFFLLANLFYRSEPANSVGDEGQADGAGLASCSQQTSMTTLTQPPTPASQHPDPMPTIASMSSHSLNGSALNDHAADNGGDIPRQK